jgi:hypothetical protein
VILLLPPIKRTPNEVRVKRTASVSVAQIFEMCFVQSYRHHWACSFIADAQMAQVPVYSWY